jgi:hypothetical protein
MRYTISEQQYNLLIGLPSPKKIYLNEGRKENLRKKYLPKFKGTEKLLDIILDNEVLVGFKHKYTDFLLKNTEFDYIDTFEPTLEARIYDIELFNKYQNQLDKTNIYDYSDFNELRKALEPFVEKEIEKKLSSEIKIIYKDKDNRFLVIMPKTKQAACEYGRQTKWCVAMKDRDYFNEYTKGDQKLYYIIDRKNSNHPNYSKVAIQFDNNGTMRYWDSKDIQMSDSAFSVLEYAFPEMIQAIRDDYESYAKSELLERLFKVFNTPQELHTSITDYFGPNSELFVYVGDFSAEEDYFANGVVSVYLRIESKIYALDNAYLYIRYITINDEYIKIDVTIDDSEFEPTVDLNLRNIRIPALKKRIVFSSMSDQIKEEISEIIIEQIMRDQSSLDKIVNFGIEKRKEINIINF